jgi:uncharacterized protein involved in exopolysaccharide biosynthesis
MRVAAIGLAASALLAFLLPQRFESTTEIMPPDPQSLSLGMTAALARASGALGSTALDLLGATDSGSTFISILQSRTIQDRLIDRFNLMRVYGYRYRKDARKKLAERTSISEDRKSRVISVSVSDRDPHRAADLAHAYIDELNRLSAELNTSAARREKEFIEGRLNSVKQDLDQASKNFSEFASKNTTIDIKEQGRAMVDAAATLQGQLIASQSELQGLQQMYAEGNVRVRSVKARVEELKRQLEKLGGTDASLQPGSPSGSSELYPSIRKLPLLGVQYADLYQQVKIQETVYELLTQQYEMAKIQEAREIPSIKVLDDAEVPEKRSFPPRLLIILLGAVMCLAGSCLAFILSDRWRTLEPHHPWKEFIGELSAAVHSNTRRWISVRRPLRVDGSDPATFWPQSSNGRNGDSH